MAGMMNARTRLQAAINIPLNQTRSLESFLPSIAKYGAIGDGKTSDEGAFTAAESADAGYHVPAGIYRITSDITLSKFINFAPGAVLCPISGVFVTITGGITAGFWTIFDLSLGGSVVGPIKNEFVYPDWWGACPSGNEDQVPAIQQSIRFAQNGNRAVYLRGGRWRCDSTLSITEPCGVYGDPGGLSVLDFSHATDDRNGLAVRRIRDFPISGVFIRDITIHRDSLSSPGSGCVGLSLESVVHSEVERVYVRNWDTNYAIRGTGSWPSSHCVFKSCHAQDAATSHLDISHASDLEFHGCSVGGGPASSCCKISCPERPGFPAAVHFRKCSFTSPQSSYGAYVLSGHRNSFEDCSFEEMNEAGILIDISTADTPTVSLSVRECDFRNCGDGIASIGAAGTFRIRDNRIESTPDANQYPIYINSSGGQVERDIIIEGNILRHSGSNTHGIVLANVNGAVIRDNRIYCSGAAAANSGIRLDAPTHAVRVIGNRTLTTHASADGIQDGGNANVLRDNSKI